MPELPEVEIYSRYLAKHALGQPIRRVRVSDERILGGIRKETFAAALRGRAFRDVRRHGKHLFADAKGVWLHLHFGMTGDLAYYEGDDPRFARVVFDFANGAHLAFEDMRLFGIADLTPDPAAYIAGHGLGADPLDPAFTLPRFRNLLAGRRGAIKSLLMSQDVIAGIGNLYADETLFQTSIHPRRPVSELSDNDIRQTYMTIRRILRGVIARKSRGADHPPRFLILHREEEEQCPRCGGSIERTVVSGRTTYFCGAHQR
ncbi:MAG TPA: DNA-formamidopyrimidine glycosylase family protein [Thermoanaerobaculia bacterium]|nr:DNA-formamidopyrimidine glycosylase family protein [Thermoanaerobaculia bacterium]